MFKPGAIRKIQVRNFVTYSFVEMYPGPNLNMIIGPNGTGKSTMVAAIILGLGGNPKIVGRGTRLAEYVKHNCESATINIYLHSEQERDFLQITREFDLRDRTTWKLNGVNATAAEIQECVSHYNIQVNNLCQFLPQDRVQEFAKLNKKDLLRNTQTALCRDDLIEKQNTLIGSRERHKEYLQLIDRHSKKLQDAQEQNARIEGRVKNLNKKQKYQEKVEHIDRKIAWTVYENHRAKLSEIKADRNQAQSVYDKYKNAMKPMETEVNNLKKDIAEIQQKKAKVSERIRSTESSMRTHNEIEILGGKIRDIADEMNNEIAQIEQWDREIEGSHAKLENMKTLHREATAKCEEGERERNASSSELARFTTHLCALRDRKEEVEQALQDSHAELRALEHEHRRLADVKQQRLQALQRIDQQAYQAVMWLRNNKHLFKSEIFEPMMLEINVLDNSKAAYVESCIPLRDRLAFTCVDKQDMNLLIRSLRDKQKLSVNVLHSDYDGGRRSTDQQFQPDAPIERLRRFGFYTYVKSLFTAPDPIMHYLCKTYSLHNIPVGDATTDDCFEQIPRGVRSFFSNTYRYHISYSKYSGEKSTRQTEVRRDGGLSMSLDLLRLGQLEAQTAELKSGIEQYGAQVRNLEGQIAQLQGNVGRIREKLRRIQNDKQQAQALATRIQGFQRTVAEMEQRKKCPDDIRRQALLKIRKFKVAWQKANEAAAAEFKNLSLLLTQNGLSSARIEAIRAKVTRVEEGVGETRRKCREAADTLDAIKDRYAGAMQEAKAQLGKAKALSKGYTPADEGFDQFREIFEGLTADIEELNSERKMLQSRMACLNTADTNELKEYEDRAQTIENLMQEIERANLELNKITSKMDRLLQEWLAPLQELVGEINLRFATAFERMGCAGEVSICTGENDKDFAEYGLCIKVTFRNGEPLQELNSNIQSGGERAVATAAFMLALQELTPVPFRCVDEINQGMDANNERRIFELIVETTCQPDTAQYFLITPKLVPHLRYSKQMVVHLVHNGPFVVQDRKWGFSTLCNPQRAQIH